MKTGTSWSIDAADLPVTAPGVQDHKRTSCSPLVLVIENIASGAFKEPAERERLRSVLDEAGLDAKVVTVDSGAAIHRAIDEHCRSGCDTVVAAGGDGTVNAVAARVSCSGMAMGVVPGGTLNHFAKDLGIPQDLRGAVETLKSGAVVPVDVGEVNGRIFLNNSGVGIYPRIVKERDEIQRRGWRKWTAATLAAFSSLRRPPTLNLRLDVDGRTLDRRTPFLFIGNNIYTLKGPALGSRTRLDQGLLSVVVGHRMSRLSLALAPIKALFGILDNSDQVDALSAREVVVYAPAAELPVSLDGEVEHLSTPLRYLIRPAGLRVLAPAPRGRE